MALELRAEDNVVIFEAIGDHFSRAGESGKAYRHLAGTALKLWQRSLTAEAWDMSERAVILAESASGDLSPQEFDKARVGVLRVRAYMSYNRGSWEQANIFWRHCKRWPPSSVIESWLPKLSDRGVALKRLGRADAGRRMIEDVVEKARSSGDRGMVMEGPDGWPLRLGKRGFGHLRGVGQPGFIQRFG